MTHTPPTTKNPQTKQQWEEIEKRFIAWALARDDDWWEEGQGHISIWDVRIMLDFFKQELHTAKQEVLQEVEEMVQDEKYPTDTESAYYYIHCAEVDIRNQLRVKQRQALTDL